MGIVHPDVVRAEAAEIAKRIAEEDRLIEAFGLADLLPEFPQDDNYQAWQEWHRQMGRGPVTTAGMLEAYRRGYLAGDSAATELMRERIKELEAGLSRLYDLFTYVKPSAFRNGVTDQTNTIDEGEVQAGLILDRAKALLKEPDEPTAEDDYGWGCQG